MTIDEILDAENCCWRVTEYGGIFCKEHRKYECFRHTCDDDFPESLTP